MRQFQVLQNRPLTFAIDVVCVHCYANIFINVGIFLSWTNVCYLIGSSFSYSPQMCINNASQMEIVDSYW